jgi:hypothetical protein
MISVTHDKTDMLAALKVLEDAKTGLESAVREYQKSAIHEWEISNAIMEINAIDMAANVLRRSARRGLVD